VTVSDVQNALTQLMPPSGMTTQHFWPRRGGAVRIGLVNNMRGAGFRDADRQFRARLHAAGQEEGINVTMGGYCLQPPGRDGWDGDYRPVAALDADWPDALIITGAEPSTDDLREEAYYPALVRVIDQAIRRRTPVLFSCLATHAAVLHLSGVTRQRRARKCHGVLRFEVRREHPLMAGMGDQIIVPHSRWNGLAAASLTSHGYRILAASARWGVERFVHDDAPGCVFLQGHPEYEPASLALEYRRDVRRYLTREAVGYPTLPIGCFNAATRSALRSFQRAVQGRFEPALMDALPLPPARADTASPWQPDAMQLYRNWLETVAASRVPMGAPD
jgi:homoserine O-succinyltransferase